MKRTHEKPTLVKRDAVTANIARLARERRGIRIRRCPSKATSVVSRTLALRRWNGISPAEDEMRGVRRKCVTLTYAPDISPKKLP